MTHRPRHVHAIALVPALAAALLAPPSFASESRRDGDLRRQAAAPAVDAQAALSAVRAAGYDGIRELEWERGYWEVRARDAQGRSVVLCVDGATAGVTSCRAPRAPR